MKVKQERGQWKYARFYFLWFKKSLWVITAAMKLKQTNKQNKQTNKQTKTLVPQKKNYDKARQHIKKQRDYFADKSPSSQSYGFSSGHVWM